MGGRRWWVLVALIAAVLPLAADFALVTVAMPSLAHELDSSRAQVAWSVATLPAVAALSLPLANAALRHGVRRLLLAGLAVALIAVVAEAAAPSLGWLVAARALVGVGAAAVLPAALRVVQAVFEPVEHPRAVAIWAGFTGLAVATGGLIGGGLVGRFWPGSVFAVQAPLLFVGLAMLIFLLPPGVEGPSSAGDKGWSGPAAPAAVFGLSGALVAVSYRLQSQGWSAVRAGVLLLVAAIALSVCARAAGPLADRSGRRTVCVAGLAVVAASVAALAGVTSGSSSALLMVSLAAGTALALGSVDEGGSADPVLRLLAVGLGVVVLGSFEPRAGFLIAAAVALGAALVSAARPRRAIGR